VAKILREKTYGIFVLLSKCIISDITNKTKNITNITRAISAAMTAMPAKPRTPAMIAIIKNVKTHCNMMRLPFRDIKSYRILYSSCIVTLGNP